MKTLTEVKKLRFEKISWEPLSQKKTVDLKSLVGPGKEVKRSTYPLLQNQYSLLVP